MKQKFSNSKELHEFFLSELKKIVGIRARVEAPNGLFNYAIYSVGYDNCLWQATIRDLFEFITKFKLSYYIDFKLGLIRVYTDYRRQMAFGLL